MSADIEVLRADAEQVVVVARACLVQELLDAFRGPLRLARALAAPTQDGEGVTVFTDEFDAGLLLLLDGCLHGLILPGL